MSTENCKLMGSEEYEKFYRLQEVIKQIETLETEKYNLKKELKIL